MGFGTGLEDLAAPPERTPDIGDQWLEKRDWVLVKDPGDDPMRPGSLFNLIDIIWGDSHPPRARDCWVPGTVFFHRDDKVARIINSDLRFVEIQESQNA